MAMFQFRVPVSYSCQWIFSMAVLRNIMHFVQGILPGCRKDEGLLATKDAVQILVGILISTCDT